ncbi:hypothetical protein C8Q80DRAFT_123656 [Daedaleopsis nitida]|nr:hypothetical protein C8Q80DRAFT_123656 [Daedaleopsis nitida]
MYSHSGPQCGTVLNDANPRAHHIESLKVDSRALYRDEELDKVASTHGVTEELVYCSDDALRLLISLLQNACNLRSLILSDARTDIILRMGCSHDFFAALTGPHLRRLQLVDLFTVNASVLAHIGRPYWYKLRALSFTCYGPGLSDWEIDSAPSIIPILLDTLPRFSHLHTLQIHAISLAADLDAWTELSRPRPLCPSICRLYFTLDISVPPPRAIYYLISQCPNLELLSITPSIIYGPLAHKPPEPLPSASAASFPVAWPSLRVLDVGIADMYYLCFSAPHPVQVRPVYRLHTPVPLLVPGSIHHMSDHPGDQRSMLLDILRSASPVWAPLWLELGAVPVGFWREVSSCAPRLRYLDLKISLPYPHDAPEAGLNDPWLVCPPANSV